MSTWTPSIVPRGDDETVYLVTDDLGKLGAVWREADVEATDLETVITDPLTGLYNRRALLDIADPAALGSHDLEAARARVRALEQRRWRHFGEEPDEESTAYIRDVVGQIRQMLRSNGSKEAKGE